VNTGFYQVFKGKLDKMKKSLKEELEKAKSERRRDWLKGQVKECKRLQKLVNEMEEHMDLPKTCCPHCGEKI